MLFSQIFSFSRGNDEIFSWKSLFFYRCTDEILFAPLKPQGADSRLNHIRENTVAAAPPPCSPKSIYVLANLVGAASNQAFHMILTYQFKLEITPLCDTALADIKTKTSLDNVPNAASSWVTAASVLYYYLEHDTHASVQSKEDHKDRKRAFNPEQAQGCTAELHSTRLYHVQSLPPIWRTRAPSILPVLLWFPRQPLHAVRWLRDSEGWSLCIVPGV